VSAKTHTTAVVLIPPAEVWPAIQAVRQRHDRNARRWMPHITLLYPFAPRSSFPQMLPALGAACAGIAPFAITFARLGMFGHGRRGATLFLAPEPTAPLVALQSRLWEAAPDYDDTRHHASSFTPHLSIGQARDTAEAQALREALESSWRPLSFTAEAIQLLWRGEPPDDVFRVAHTLPLASP
jgi:2'-5' RNA ligase